MSKPVRVLFIGRSIAHFLYIETTLAGLLRRGASVELFFDEGWSHDWAPASSDPLDEFTVTHPELITGWAPRRADGWRNFLFSIRELRSYRSYLTRPRSTSFYVRRWANYQTPNLKRLIEKNWFRVMLRTPIADLTLRFCEWIAPSDPGLLAVLSDKQPDVMVASPADLRFSEETDFIKAARRLRIPTAIQVLTWDNLSTKGLSRSCQTDSLSETPGTTETPARSIAFPSATCRPSARRGSTRWAELRVERPFVVGWASTRRRRSCSTWDRRRTSPRTKAGLLRRSSRLSP
jgi:hypothetical protein